MSPENIQAICAQVANYPLGTHPYRSPSITVQLRESHYHPLVVEEVVNWIDKSLWATGFRSHGVSTLLLSLAKSRHLSPTAPILSTLRHHVTAFLQLPTEARDKNSKNLPDFDIVLALAITGHLDDHILAQLLAQYSYYPPGTFELLYRSAPLGPQSVAALAENNIIPLMATAPNRLWNMLPSPSIPLNSYRVHDGRICLAWCRNDRAWARYLHNFSVSDPEFLDDIWPEFWAHTVATRPNYLALVHPLSPELRALLFSRERIATMLATATPQVKHALFSVLSLAKPSASVPQAAPRR